MPQPPSANMALVLPTEASDTGVWGSLINAALGLVDQHDHSPGKGPKIPLATAATITADVPWASGGSFFSITNLKAIDFQPQATGAVSAYAGALFVNSANNELTFRSTGGTNIQLTSGTTLNIPGVGGFGGDYSGVGALADFTDSSDTYAFRQQVGSAVRQYARVAHGDLDLFEYKAHPAAGVPTTRVRLKSPAALAASYDLTWPAALPGSQQLLQVSNTGAITASNTVPGAASFGSTVGVTGAFTGGDVGSFVGLLTASAGITLGTNASIQMNGFGNYKHSGVRTISDSVKLGTTHVQAGGTGFTAGTVGISLNNNSIVYVPLPSMPFQNRLVNCRIWFASAADATACTSTLYATGTGTTAGSSFLNTGVVLSSGGTSVAAALNVNSVNSNSQTYWIQVSNGVSTPRILAVTVDYDVP